MFWWPWLEVYYWNIQTLLSVIYEKCSWTCYPFLHSCKLLQIVATMQQFVFLQMSLHYTLWLASQSKRKKVAIKTGRREERRMSIHHFGLYDCCHWLSSLSLCFVKGLEHYHHLYVKNMHSYCSPFVIYLKAGPLEIVIEFYNWKCLFCYDELVQSVCLDLWLKGFSFVPWLQTLHLLCYFAKLSLLTMT